MLVMFWFAFFLLICKHVFVGYVFLMMNVCRGFVGLVAAVF